MVLGVSPVVGEVTLSEKLTRIASRVGDGGVHFSVTDSTDDLRRLGQFLDKVLKEVPDAEIPPGFRVEELLGDLGLLAIEGSGESSKKAGDLWHNRTFLLTNGKHEGLLSLFGDKPAPSSAGEFAPSGADLVLETKLDLRQMEKMARKIAAAAGPEAEAQTGAALMELIPGTDLSMADLLGGFSVRGTLVFWLDDTAKFELGPEASYPVPHFAARLENAAVVWSILKKNLGDMAVVSEAGGEVIFALEAARQETPFGVLEPRFVWNAEQKELFFSLTPGDLAICRGNGPKVAVDEDFKNATVGIPDQTNGLAYFSSDLLKTLVGLGKEFSGEVPAEARGVVEWLLPELDEMAKKGGYAAAFSVEEDGLLFVANLPVPLKGGSGVSGLGGIAMVSMMAGVATPLILRAQKAGNDAESSNLLKNYAGAQAVYRIDNGKYAATPRDLVKAGLLPLDVLNDLSASGFENLVGTHDDFEDMPKAVLAFLPSQKDPSAVIVAHADGSVTTISFEELTLRLEGQSE